MRYLALLLAFALASASAAPRDVRTQAVYDYLLSIWGKNIIAGQADLTPLAGQNPPPLAGSKSPTS